MHKQMTKASTSQSKTPSQTVHPNVAEVQVAAKLPAHPETKSSALEAQGRDQNKILERRPTISSLGRRKAVGAASAAEDEVGVAAEGAAEVVEVAEDEVELEEDGVVVEEDEVGEVNGRAKTDGPLHGVNHSLGVYLILRIPLG